MDPVEEIKTRIDIVDVVSQYVDLKRAGKNYKALCPFHSEKTPSFVVFPDSQSWRCFGACSEGGDVYSFLMKKNGWDFAETLRALAAQTGVELRPRTPEQAQRREAFERLYELLDAATLYYMHLLRNAPEAEFARTYVTDRQLDSASIEKFQLGYALDAWNAAHHYLLDKGYSEDELLNVGLLIHHDDTGRRYDRFRGRLMIPIRDLRGRVVGFGARALLPDAVPKYLNSPQTDLFDKSALLYGLDLSKKGIREAGEAVVVEGYMDVIQAHQAGYPNVIAQMGTALTEAQLRQLKRYTGRLVLALDADAAGQKATLRGLDVARQTLDREVEVVFDPRGLVRHEARLRADIRIVTLPSGYDPDKLIKEDRAAWEKLITTARPVVEYIIDSVVAAVDPADAKTKSAAVNRAIPIIRDVANAVERDHYTQYLARRLSIDARTLTAMVTRPASQAWRPPSRARGRGTPPPPPPPPEWDDEASSGQSTPTQTPVAPAGAALGQEMYCLNQMIVAPTVWRQADHLLAELGFTPILEGDFVDPRNRSVFAALKMASAVEEIWDRVDESLHEWVHTVQTLEYPVRMGGRALDLPPEKVASDVAYTVLLLRKEAAERAKRQLDSLWADALVENDRHAVGEYHQQVLELKSLRLRIDQALEQIHNPLANGYDRDQ
jgi:DNA primase